MTFWAKLLSLIVLVLAIFFAAVSTVLFAKKQDWRGKYEDLSKQYRILDKDFADTKADLEMKLTNLRADRDRLQAEATQLTLRVQNLTAQVGQLRADLDEKKVLVIDLTTNLAGMEKLAEKWEEKNEELRGERDGLATELLTTRTDLKNQRIANSEQATKIADLEDERDGLKKDRAVLTSTLELKNQILDTLYERFVIVRPYIEKPSIVPDIRGKVLLVDKEAGYVFIDVGSKQGVERNLAFTVFRGDMFVAKIRIIDLQDGDISAGEIIVQKEEIELGDDVATRIGY